MGAGLWVRIPLSTPNGARQHFIPFNISQENLNAKGSTGTQSSVIFSMSHHLVLFPPLTPSSIATLIALVAAVDAAS